MSEQGRGRGLAGAFIIVLLFCLLAPLADEGASVVGLA